MNCPYCDEDIKDIDEVNMHILKFHPEKTSLEDFREAKTTRMWTAALDLTATTFGNHARQLDKEKVLETFKFYLRELMKSEG